MDTIFKTDANGRERMFEIHVEKLKDGTANIVKTTGLVYGKKQQSIIHVPLGYKSALKRAQTMWNNQHNKDILPMLAHNYEDRMRYVNEPMYVQPKLDGVRILVNNKGGISRTGKSVPGTESWGKGLEDGEYLDGECYVHGMNFETITSLFKTHPEQLEFHVFDYYNVNKPHMTFEERMKYATVETRMIHDRADVYKAHESFTSRGYEGVMIRNPRSTYEPGKRSNGLLKLKSFNTEEFTIVGVHEGSGRDVGTPVWECQTESGDVFSVRPEGSIESRRKAFENKNEIIGKKLTVKYQNMTTSGIPRFPVGIAIRDYE